MGDRGYNVCLIITSMDSLTIHITSTRSILYLSTAFKPTLVCEIIFFTLYNQQSQAIIYTCIQSPFVKHSGKF